MATYAAYQFQVVDEAGNIVPGANVAVRDEAPGFPLVTIYADRDGSTPLGNPFTADSNGYALFFVAGGAYKIVADDGNGFSRTWRFQAIGLLAEKDDLPLPSPLDADTLEGHSASEFQVNGVAREIDTDAEDIDITDQGKFIHFTGTSPLTANLDAPADLGDTFRIFVKNLSTRRARLAASAIDGDTSLDLMPYQSCVVLGNGAALYSIGKNNRWAPPPSSSRAEFYVHPTLGNADNDGLAAGAGNAFASIQAATTFALTKVDSRSLNPPKIYCADGTYNLTAGIQITEDSVGRNQVSFEGNPTHPENVILVQATAGEAGFYVKDKGIATINGFQFQPTGNCFGIDIGHLAVTDVFNVIMKNHGIGTHFRAAGHSSMNIDGSYQVKGNATAHIQADFGAHVEISNAVATGDSNLTFTYFLLASEGASIRYAGSSSFSGFASITAQKYLVQINSTLNKNGLTIPGSIAGATATGGQAV